MQQLTCVACAQALVGPLKFFRGTRRVWRCVLASWLLAAIVAIPQTGLVSVRSENRSLSPPNTTQDIDVDVYYKCGSSGYTAEWQRKLYFTFLALLLLVIPACIMLFCYANIVRAVWLRAGTEAARNIDMPRVHFVTSRRPATASDAIVCSTRRRKHSRCVADCRSVPPSSSAPVAGDRRKTTLMTKRSVIRMAISVTAGFMVCITPVFVVTSVRVYSDYRYPSKAADVVTGLLALSQSIN